jgi:5-methylcytosine-specific restriction endonuclease McrA
VARRRRSNAEQLADNAALAQPKPLRLIDEAALQRCRDRGFCEVCGRTAPIEPHHLKSRGARGDDADANLVSTCHECHDKAHRGLISRARLLEIVANRWDPA